MSILKKSKFGKWIKAIWCSKQPVLRRFFHFHLSPKIKLNCIGTNVGFLVHKSCQPYNFGVFVSLIKSCALIYSRNSLYAICQKMIASFLSFPILFIQNMLYTFCDVLDILGSWCNTFLLEVFFPNIGIFVPVAAS